MAISVVKVSKRQKISNYFINASASVEVEAETECPVIAYHAIAVLNQERKTDPEVLTAKEKRQGTNFSL